MNVPAAVFVAAVFLAAPAEPAACPDCPTARAARVEVFDRDFGRNLLMALAPFLVIAVVAAAAHRAGP